MVELKNLQSINKIAFIFVVDDRISPPPAPCVYVHACVHVPKGQRTNLGVVPYEPCTSVLFV